jgi:hypothetical protein
MEEQKKTAPVKVEVDPQVELQKYELRVKGMSHRQLVAELKGIANRKHNGKDFCMNPPKGMPLENRNSAGLDNAEAIVNLIILENTQTAKVLEFKKNGDPKRFARKDQIGNGTMSHFLR